MNTRRGAFWAQLIRPEYYFHRKKTDGIIAERLALNTIRAKTLPSFGIPRGRVSCSQHPRQIPPLARTKAKVSTPEIFGVARHITRHYSSCISTYLDPTGHEGTHRVADGHVASPGLVAAAGGEEVEGPVAPMAVLFTTRNLPMPPKTTILT